MVGRLHRRIDGRAGCHRRLGRFAPIRQAYVELRANVGNGIDFKVGQWDNIIGFEGTDSYANLNWTRSYGYTIEPTEHVGVLAEYVFNPSVDLKVGVANELMRRVCTAISAAAASASATIESKKAIVSLLSFDGAR